MYVGIEQQDSTAAEEARAAISSQWHLQCKSVQAANRSPCHVGIHFITQQLHPCTARPCMHPPARTVSVHSNRTASAAACSRSISSLNCVRSGDSAPPAPAHVTHCASRNSDQLWLTAASTACGFLQARPCRTEHRSAKPHAPSHMVTITTTHIYSNGKQSIPGVTAHLQQSSVRAPLGQAAAGTDRDQTALPAAAVLHCWPAGCSRSPAIVSSREAQQRRHCRHFVQPVMSGCCCVTC